MSTEPCDLADPDGTRRQHTIILLSPKERYNKITICEYDIKGAIILHDILSQYIFFKYYILLYRVFHINFFKKGVEP